MTTTRSLPEQTPAPSSRPRRAALSAIAVAGVVGVVAAAVLVLGDDESASAAPLTQVEASCEDWRGSAPTATSDAQWCTDMFAWMDDRSGTSMMGNGMWQGPEEMGRTCRAWVAAERGDTGTAGPSSCDAMLAWMDGHMSSQGGRWMMQRR